MWLSQGTFLGSSSTSCVCREAADVPWGEVKILCSALAQPPWKNRPRVPQVQPL